MHKLAGKEVQQWKNIYTTWYKLFIDYINVTKKKQSLEKDNERDENKKYDNMNNLLVPVMCQW